MHTCFKYLLKVSLLYVFLFNSYSNFGQTENLFINNFQLKKIGDNQIFDITHDSNGLMLFANSKGILSFDGINWQVIKTPDIPLSFSEQTETGLIFVACNNNFGYISKNDTGCYLYHSIFENSIKDGIKSGTFNKVLVNKNHVYFCSRESVYKVSKDDLKIENHWCSDTTNFSGFFIFKDEFYINIENKGLHVIRNDSLRKIPNTSIFADKEILFGLTFDFKYCLLGTNDNKLLLFNGEKIFPYDIKDKEFLEQSILVGGKELSEEEIVLSTLIGGCIIVKKKWGETLQTINYQTGLPDEEIFSMGIDANQGLWISHGFGLSRVDLFVPIFNYSLYSDLKGNPISVCVFNDTIYTATSEGVFYLSQQKQFQEKEVLVKKSRKVYKTKKAEEEVKDEEKSKKEKRLFWFFRKKKDKNKPKSLVSKDKRKEQLRSVSNKYYYVKKTIQKLLNVNYVYKKVEDLNEKCKQLVSFKNHLLAVTNTGLYDIVDNKASIIKSDIYIYSIVSSPNDSLFYIGTDNGLYSVKYVKDEWLINHCFSNIENDVYSLVFDNGNNNLWIGSINVAFKLTLDSTFLPLENKPYFFDNEFSEQVIIGKLNNKPYFFLPSGIYYYDNDADTIIRDEKLSKEIDESRYVFSVDGETMINDGKNWQVPVIIQNINPLSVYFINLFNDIRNFYIDKNQIWIIDNNSIYKLSQAKKDKISEKFTVYISSIKDSRGEKFPLKDIKLDYTNNSVELNLSAPFFINPENTTYQYFISGLMNSWSEWSTNSIIKLPFIPDGRYLIQIRAKNVLGYLSETKSIEIYVKPPFWKEIWFYSCVFLVIIIAIYLLIKKRERKLIKEKELLEEEVRKRTIKIEKQKKEITDSIKYAKRIQSAALPPEELIQQHLPEHFVLFKPRDIVSGDFYWMKQINNYTVITAADCTGHGVPGAFMSMLGMALLNEIVRDESVTQANQVLNKLRAEIKLALRQTGKEGEAKDGMDIALCVIDKENMKLQYAGAYNPLYLYRKKSGHSELIETKADKMPIGIHMKEKSFTNHEIDIQENDVIYIFSDGFIDQFGGWDEISIKKGGVKFKSKRFKKLLEDINDKKMSEQKEILNNTIEQWKGTNDQVDDILIIGIKIK
ncbi:MAG: hypothetical protein DRJ01_07555 [Bacteroidetes bacterium]|nr:MAG: hypothetical protein DRJ01_07555 [Bacteroidota bacterium]